MKQKYANTSNDNLNVPMTTEQWDVVDFIAFESETAVIYPFAIAFNHLTMEMIERIAVACNGHTCNTETLYEKCECVLGINPELNGGELYAKHQSIG